MKHTHTYLKNLKKYKRLFYLGKKLLYFLKNRVFNLINHSIKFTKILGQFQMSIPVKML